MGFINIEIKAKSANPKQVRDLLLEKGAVFMGVDEQTDTYFDINKGRLKLRQGNIENSLIFYNRVNQAGPKQSDCELIPVADGGSLLNILSKSLDVLVTVKKKREIYFIENVKFHIDIVDGLGDFVEIEASNKTHDIQKPALEKQCRYYMDLFGIKTGDLIDISYSDLLIQKL